ncbi:hypothetical protein BWQ96_02065 [Gracilariopsis chorda]|uniref:RING-type domain-containing protein n=1 Tax=Gracilariopsis chorda TaxID=448386 RepID=A0A2V3J1C4_9FLOR|nr:hypothetical protein BWQ96_02065 [Gracilariopsis chorda]|eukprot:PXF48113.1 hypothetical protein BWQ96_02065 [Gracilariopsis chorda]
MVSQRNRFFSLFVRFSIVVWIGSVTTVHGRNWFYTEVPNPSNDIGGKCGHFGKLKYVCDPEMYLAPKEADKIDLLLTYIRNGTHGFKKVQCTDEAAQPVEKGPEVLVVVLSSLKRSLFETGSKDLRACRFATKLIGRWNVGASSCGYGVIILLSVQNRAIAVSPTVYAKIKITERVKEGVKQLMQKTVRHKEYGESLLDAVDAVGTVLADGTPPFSLGISVNKVFQNLSAVAMVGLMGLMCYIAYSKVHLQHELPGTTKVVHRVIGGPFAEYAAIADTDKQDAGKVVKKNVYATCAICRLAIENEWDLDTEAMFCSDEPHDTSDEDDPLLEEIVINDDDAWKRFACEHPVHVKCYMQTVEEHLKPSDIQEMLCPKCCAQSAGLR